MSQEEQDKLLEVERYVRDTLRQYKTVKMIHKDWDLDGCLGGEMSALARRLEELDAIRGSAGIV